MKKLYLILVLIGLVTLVSNESANVNAEASAATSPNLVVSQFQVAGGVHNDEFVELHNISSDPVDLNGHVLVYRSANGSNDATTPLAAWTTTTIVPAGGYYLVTASTYDGSVVGDTSYNSSMVAMSGTGGGIAIRHGAPNTGLILDSVGYGSATNIFVEGTVTPAPAANSGQSRLNNACQDTDNNLNDFSNTNPSAPRNSSATANVCSGGGTNLFAAISASPTTVSPGGNILFTVTVIPATTPPSTGIAVVGNLTNIGGSAAQTFFDDGTNGDTTGGDNVFSYLATIPVGSTGGVRNVTAVASDAQARTVNLNQNITINAPLPDEDPLLLGNPSNATPDIGNENNYLMQKPQYSLSYNRSRATANWVAWRLDSSWIGTTPRQDDFRPDQTLPMGWYQVLDTDYSGSGYQRGHMCPSGDRTNSIPNNSATFLMTNMVPQLPENNTGPWEDFESYCRTVAGQGNELYIISGVHGNAGTIAQGRIVVPLVTWKVVLVIPNGANDLQRINKATRAFGIIVPNQPPVDQQAPWRTFRVTVDNVEALTGHNFFSAVPAMTQMLIERRRDVQ